MCFHAHGCGLNSNQTKEADSTTTGFLMEFYWTASLHMLHMLFFRGRRIVMAGRQGVQSVIRL